MAKGTNIGFLNFGIDGDNKELLKKLEQVKKEAISVEQYLQNINKLQSKSGTNKAPTLLQQAKAQDVLNQSVDKQRLIQSRTNEIIQRTANAQTLNYQRLQTEIARTNNLTQGLGNSTNNLQSLLLKVGGTAAFIQLAKEIVNVRGEMQQLDIAFSTMLKSPEKAAKLMSELKEFAVNTPFGLMDSAKGAKQLIAYGFQANTLIKDLEMLGDVAAGVSAPINDIIYLYGTLRTQGRAYAVDMRQFANRGIPIYEEIAKVLGITKDEVMEFVSAGKVGFKEIEQAFKNMTSETGMYGGLMRKQTESVTGQLEKLKDNIQFMFNNIGESSEGAIYTAIEGASTLVENYEAIGKILLGLVTTYGAYKTAVMLTAVAENIRYQATLAQMAGYTKMGALTEVLKAKTAALNKTLLSNPYAILAAAAVALAYGIYQVSTYQTEAEKAQTRLNDAMNESSTAALKEQRELAKLKGELEATKKGSEEYQKIKDEIIKKYGQYYAGLDQEIGKVGLLETTYNKLTEAINKSFGARQYTSFIEKETATMEDAMSKNLGEMQDRLISGLGEEAGTKYYTKLKNAILQGNISVSKRKDNAPVLNGVDKDVQNALDKISGYASSDWIKNFAIEGNIQNILTLQKSFDDLDKKAKVKFGIEDNTRPGGADDTTKSFKSLSDQINDARENLVKLKKEMSDLQSGKTPSENYAKSIEDKAKEVKEAQDKLSILLYGKTTSGNNKDISKNDKQLDSSQKLSEKLLQMQLETESARIAAMQDGKEKRLLEIDSEYKETLARISKNRQDLIDEYNESKGLNGGNKVTISNYQQVTPDIYKAVNDAQVQAEATKSYKIIELERSTAKEIESIRNDVNLKFRTDLENQLHEIELFYNEQVRLNKMSRDEADKLALKESVLAKQNNNLKYNDIDSGLAVAKLDNSTNGLGMTEYAERQKTAILLKYATERLTILQTMGTEQANIEAKQIQTTIDSYNKTLSKPKSIKGLIDEKVFSKVKKHFTDMGQSEEDATKNTENFFNKFTEGGKKSVEVIGYMQDAFGGLNENVDKALDAAMNIAQGFATGGLAGGIAAAGATVISTTMGLLTAKKQVDQSMIDGYNGYVEAIDRLIDKQIESLESLGAGRFAETTLKTYNDLIKRMQASRSLFTEYMGSGSGMFSHSIGYKANKMLRGYTTELRKAGIYTTDLNKMTNEQLISLMSMPDIWGRLHGDLRKYIEEMAEAKDQADELKDEIQSIMLGFNFNDITDAIVDAFTDNSINDALNTVSDKVDDWIGGIVGNIIKQVALIEPITKAVDNLMKGIGKYDSNGNLIGFKGKDQIDSDVFKQFKDTVMNVASGFGDVWQDMIKELSGMNINIGGSSSSSDSTLSKGAQALTEDTGDILASYINAMRAEQAKQGVNIMQLVTIAQLHTDQFANMYAELLRIQVNTLATANNTAQLVTLTEEIKSTSNDTNSILKRATLNGSGTGFNLYG